MGYDYGPAPSGGGIGWIGKAVVIAILAVIIFFVAGSYPSIMEALRPSPRPVVEDSSGRKEYQLTQGASVTVSVTVRNAGGDGNVIITVSVHAPGTSTYTKTRTIYMVANARQTEEFEFDVGATREDYDKSWTFEIDVKKV